MSDRQLTNTLEERDFYKERYEKLLPQAARNSDRCEFLENQLQLCRERIADLKADLAKARELVKEGG